MEKNASTGGGCSRGMNLFCCKNRLTESCSDQKKTIAGCCPPVIKFIEWLAARLIKVVKAAFFTPLEWCHCMDIETKDDNDGGTGGRPLIDNNVHLKPGE